MAKIRLNNPSEIDDEQISNVSMDDNSIKHVDKFDTYDDNDIEIDKTAQVTSDDNDPDKIEVTISDKRIPLVILFGPPTCGKTMTMIRLARFLKKEGYEITPVKTFRNSNDKTYEKDCNQFNEKIRKNEAPEGTGNINFMLIDITKKGRRLCQILEAPGEGFFDPSHPEKSFRGYVKTIINSENRKIWCIVVEPDWLDKSDRNAYVSRIELLKSKMDHRDRTIFIFNKIDKTKFVISRGRVNIREAFREVESLYEGIFDLFENKNPITRFFSKWRCDFIPFQTADFTKAIDSSIMYQEGPNEYPSRLWSTILKHIKG